MDARRVVTYTSGGTANCAVDILMPSVPSMQHAPHQRTSGTGRLSTGLRDGNTNLVDLYQEGAAKIRNPDIHAPPILEAVFMNTAGGLTGGDRMRWAVDVGDRSSVVLTTPTCEKIYRSLSGHAKAETQINVGRNALLSYLPQETILFDQSAFDRRLTVDLEPHASALIVESVLFGRQAMGETVKTTFFRDRWRIRQSGTLIHAEDFLIDGDVGDLLESRAVTNGAVATATILMVSPYVDGLVEPVRALLDGNGGASTWHVGGRDKMLIRLTAESGYELRKQLLPILLRCNKNLLGSETYGLPKVWNL